MELRIDKHRYLFRDGKRVGIAEARVNTGYGDVIMFAPFWDGDGDFPYIVGETRRFGRDVTNIWRVKSQLWAAYIMCERGRELITNYAYHADFSKIPADQYDRD